MNVKMFSFSRGFSWGAFFTAGGNNVPPHFLQRRCHIIFVLGAEVLKRWHDARLDGYCVVWQAAADYAAKHLKEETLCVLCWCMACTVTCLNYIITLQYFQLAIVGAARPPSKKNCSAWGSSWWGLILRCFTQYCDSPKDVRSSCLTGKLSRLQEAFK